MTTVTVDGITYTISAHAEDQMAQRAVTTAMVEAVMLDPDDIAASSTSGAKLYICRLPRQRFPLVVAVDEEARSILTVFWNKPLRR